MFSPNVPGSGSWVTQAEFLKWKILKSFSWGHILGIRTTALTNDRKLSFSMLQTTHVLLIKIFINLTSVLQNMLGHWVVFCFWFCCIVICLFSTHYGFGWPLKKKKNKDSTVKVNRFFWQKLSRNFQYVYEVCIHNIWYIGNNTF